MVFLVFSLRKQGANACWSSFFYFFKKGTNAMVVPCLLFLPKKNEKEKKMNAMVVPCLLFLFSPSPLLSRALSFLSPSLPLSLSHINTHTHTHTHR
jgi:hypothetical protein